MDKSSCKETDREGKRKTAQIRECSAQTCDWAEGSGSGRIEGN